METESRQGVGLLCLPPELFDGVEGVKLAERGAPGRTLLGLRLVVEPERPLPLQLVRLLCHRLRRNLRSLNLHRRRVLARHYFSDF